MSTQSIIPKTVNPDLLKERKAASFVPEEFAVWWHGGVDKLKFKRDLEKYFYDGSTEHSTLLYYKSHEEISNLAVKHSTEVAEKLKKLQQERNPGGNDYWPGLFTSPFLWPAMPLGNPLDVHGTMMVTALKSQCTEEQYARFGKRAERFEISGAYVQTELGHGTFLRGLETRADFDPKTDEFVLNTPSITAYKWWPGGLGHVANHCILVAQLYIDGKSKGVQMFFVPLRDEQTHMPLPGVDIGEIGVKMGFHGVSNGYLGLKNVRIPRLNMLMKNAEVTPDGQFVQHAVSQLTYFTMLKTRCMVVRNFVIVSSMGATIATRYSAVRRQSPINPNEPEPQILDHVTQQLKVFPEIATSVAYNIACSTLYSVLGETEAEVTRGQYARLPELHALSCALKALTSSDSATGIERLRLACGGHGYLTSSGMGLLFAAATAACTYEGENTVLLLQVGRYLLKAWKSAVEGKKLEPTVEYLKLVANQEPFGKWTGSWSNIVKALQYAAANKTRLAYESMVKRLKQGQTEGEAANNTGIEYTQAAELHGRAFVCATFLDHVQGKESRYRSRSFNTVMENLLELYLVHIALKQMSDILTFIPLSEADLCKMQDRLEKALKKLRPDAVAICDGFDYPDEALSSSLGSYDGNAYERLFELAKQSPLNQQPVPQSFNAYLKPFLQSNM